MRFSRAAAIAALVSVVGLASVSAHTSPPFCANILKGTDVGGVGYPLYADSNLQEKIDLPFAFKFYDETHVKAYVTINGVVGFSDTIEWENLFENTNNGGYNYYRWTGFGQKLEDNDYLTSYNKPFIAVLGTELATYGGGYLRRPILMADYDDDTFVIQWTQMGDQSDYFEQGTFQLWLFSDGRMLFRYPQMLALDIDNDGVGPGTQFGSFGRRAIVGVRKDFTSYTQISFMEPNIYTGDAFMLTPDETTKQYTYELYMEHSPAAMLYDALEYVPPTLYPYNGATVAPGKVDFYITNFDRDLTNYWEENGPDYNVNYQYYIATDSTFSPSSIIGSSVDFENDSDDDNQLLFQEHFSHNLDVGTYYVRVSKCPYDDWYGQCTASCIYQLNVVDEMETDVESTIWTLSTAFGIFMYQLSSILIVRAKSGEARSVATSQVVNFLTGIVAWYLVGYAFTYGASKDSVLRNRFIGNYSFAMYGIRDEAYQSNNFGYAWFIQAFAYAMVCNSIVAEVLGGKVNTTVHVLSTTFTVSFLFPVIAHWVWSSEGWLSALRPEAVTPLGTIGAIDFAGSGVVHVLGGAIGLAASVFLRKMDNPKGAVEDTDALSIATFLRIFAMYSFVTGSTISITIGHHNATDAVYRSLELAKALSPNPADVRVDATSAMMNVAVGRAAVCLTLALAGSGLLALALESFLCKELNMAHAVNALTIGFAAISSNIVTCEPWAAILCGIVAALVYVGGRRALKSLKDNDVFVIHGLGGIWGLLFTGVLAKPKFIRDVIGYNFAPSRYVLGEILGADFVGELGGVAPFTRHSGIFYPSDGPNGKLLAVMILEAAIILAWGFFLALPFFAILKALKCLKAGKYEAGKA